MQPNVKTALLLVRWAVTTSPSHLWEIPTMATTVRNHPWVPFSHGRWVPSPLLSPVLLPPQHKGSALLWGSTTLTPSPTLMLQLSLRTRASGHPACTPTTLVPAAGAAAWGWREAPSPLTCEGATRWGIIISWTNSSVLFHQPVNVILIEFPQTCIRFPFCRFEYKTKTVFYMTHTHVRTRTIFLQNTVSMTCTLLTYQKTLNENNQRYILIHFKWIFTFYVFTASIPWLFQLNSPNGWLVKKVIKKVSLSLLVWHKSNVEESRRDDWDDKCVNIAHWIV